MEKNKKRFTLVCMVLICVALIGVIVTACGTANTFIAVNQHPKANDWAAFIESSFDSMTVLDSRTGTENTYNDSKKILSVIDTIKNMEISEQPTHDENARAKSPPQRGSPLS